MDSSYVGIVTRQDVQTGVTLRAKIVTPTGNKFAFQDFKTMVKNYGISDLQACILDLNTATGLLSEKGITNITGNITSAMPSQGEHGTTIVYTYESAGNSEITDYISEAGVIKKRPLYGEPAVTGKLVITVSKGKEAVNSKLDIVISPYSLGEILEEAVDMISWDDIRGLNAMESMDSTSGTKNVMSKLNLITEIQDVPGTLKPVTVTWTVSDSVQATAEAQGLYTGARIDITTGNVSRPDYVAAYKLYETLGTSLGLSVVLGSVPMVRIGGITLVATLGIEGSSQTTTKTFLLSTLSKYLTNTEVTAWLTRNLKASLDDGSTYGQMNTGDQIITLNATESSPERIIYIPKSATGFGSGSDIGLTRISADVSAQIMDFTNPTNPKSFPSSVTVGPVADEDNGVTNITLNVKNAQSMSGVDAKKFIVQGTISVWSYSSDGISLGGETSNGKVIWKFEIGTVSPDPVDPNPAAI